ncbi:MAG: CPBP family intramembrane glutamate endopeptidase, partial [Clostridia bacterium]|nr:CPBP family intramembrane glutamate endopeptidase [Clostridia bacterium]
MSRICIMALVAIACVVMGIVDGIIQPGYGVKSAIKIVMFLLIPLIHGMIDKKSSIKNILKPDKKGFLVAVTLGIGVYVVVLGGYFLFKNIFDF